MNYHKVYMNHVHSSSLLSQLSTMWKSQTLCDAVIRTGTIITKAHRVVLVAACPMLQSMENATSGSHLEVRLASDIKQDSVNTFLQYLYEGFMMLTEENCKDVEKIARLLQVDNIIRCCADFNKCLNVSAGQQYKYSSLDQAEFRHMRTTNMLKVQEKSQKRFSESGRPPSPGSKRQRLHRPSSPTQDISGQRIHDVDSMTEGYGIGANDPWDRIPRIGSGMPGASVKPGVIDIREDSLELLQTDPPKDAGGGRHQEQRKVQSSVGISVASQHNTSADLRIVNVSEGQGLSRPPAAQQSGTATSSRQITVSPLMQLDSPSSSSSVDSSKFSSDRFTSVQRKEPERPQPHTSSVNMPTPLSSSTTMPSSLSSSDYTPMAQPSASPGRQKSQETFQTSTPQRQPYPVSLTAVRPSHSAQKPFAAGSATQAGVSQPFVGSQGGMSQSFTEGMHSSPVSQRSQQMPKPSGRSESIEIPPQAVQDSE
ncbi:hypothetical protein FSP39_018480 [Pinctada imbricata]|uniref:BTB domain-containing protein n=1 Tax=Pinctada imbricata TaxID=66713 RepID=A0AA89CB64_PINIB|nr:hypothetical protein FSP39_018480 [Pinctada imbricata]